MKFAKYLFVSAFASFAALISADDSLLFRADFDAYTVTAAAHVAGD